MITKKSKKLISAILVAAAFSFTAGAQELSFSGDLTSQLASGLRSTNSGKILAGGFKATGEFNSSSDNSSVYASGSLEWDGAKSVRTDSTENENLSGRLKEAWFDYNTGLVSLRIGRQISAWGAADSLIVADVLCPQDNNNLFAEDISESRLGIDAVRLSLTTEKVILDAYAIPFFTPETLPLKKSELLYPYTFGAYEKAGIKLGKAQMPETKLSNMEYAVRLSTYLSALDFSLYGFYGFQDSPLFELSTDGSGTYTLNGHYEKYMMAGADSSIPLGDVTLRLEGAFFPKKYFSTTTMTGTVRQNETMLLAGLDYLKNDWTITAQYYADLLLNKKEESSQDKLNQTATLNISRSLEKYNLELSASGLVNITDLDSALQLQADYDLSDSISFSLKGMLFNKGREEGQYGAYKDLSCIVLKGKYSF